MTMKKTFKLKNKWLIFSFLIVQIMGCSDSEKVVVTFPLVEECQSKVIDVLETFRRKGVSKFEYKIANFSVPLISHSGIKSFVIMESKTMGQNDLIMLANNPIGACYPQDSYSINMNKEDFSTEFIKRNQVSNLLGVKRSYAVIEDEEMTVYFHFPR